MKGYYVGDFIYAKLLIINFTNSLIGQAFTEGCLINFIFFKLP